MIKLYINIHNKNILKFIANYFSHFRCLGNAKSYTISFAAEA